MSDIKPTLAQKFRALPAGTRTSIIGGAVIVSLLAIGTVLTEDGTGKAKTPPGAKKESLTVFNPGSSGATEAVAANLEQARKRIDEQAQRINLLQEVAKQAQEKNNGADGNWSEISNLAAQVQALQERVNGMAEKGGGTSAAPDSKGLLGKLLPQASGTVEEAPGRNDAAPLGGSDEGLASPTAAPAQGPTIQVVGEVNKIVKPVVKKEKPAAYITSGSNFEAVLLNGMDASTAIGANRSPTPALLRIKSDAVMPNMFTFNVRECFVLVGGFGNMSTERVEMRTETMSCVSETGEVYEGKIEGYLVGEDGKAGARGRVVSKQGALLAKSFMAGFVGGIGGAFAPQPVQALNLDAGTNQAYQYPTGDQVVGNGIATGLNKSSTALAQFYIKLAEQMFPIVELDAGRKMTIILMKGVDLKMEKKG